MVPKSRRAQVDDVHSIASSMPHVAVVHGPQRSELTLQELTEVIQDAWLTRASARRAAIWLAEHGND